MTFPKAFKEAISHLPSKEKDKLILHLLKKDLTLVKRLIFEFLSKQSVDERRKIERQQIIAKAQSEAKTFYPIGYPKMDVGLSSDINEQVRITKDKFGEVKLNLIMIDEVLASKNNIASAKYLSKTRKFCIVGIARAFKILILISKLHKNLWLEFENELKRLGKLIASNHNLEQTAIKNGLDINWLINHNISEDIVQINKRLRQNDLLKQV